MKKLKMFMMGLCILAVFSQTGCSLFCRSIKRLQELEIGMSKTQVMQVMGDPDSARGAKKDDAGKTIEVWTYVLKRPGCGKTKMYLLRFSDNKLERWGLEQDWLRQPDSIQKNIYERESQKNKTGLY